MNHISISSNNLLKKIKSLQNSIKPPLTVCSLCELVEIDLSGKNLKELKKETLTLLAYDVTLFNDEAFRYYIFQFIELVLEKQNPFCADAFIQDLFESNILNKNTKRYLQFDFTEVRIILEYLKYILQDINFYMKPEMDEEVDEISEFHEWRDGVVDSIKFWQEHPNYEKN